MMTRTEKMIELQIDIIFNKDLDEECGYPFSSFEVIDKNGKWIPFDFYDCECNKIKSEDMPHLYRVRCVNASYEEFPEMASLTSSDVGNAIGIRFEDDYNDDDVQIVQVNDINIYFKLGNNYNTVKIYPNKIEVQN